ncbi:hypothetical protein IKF63_01950 [Candidatus Saccharibacteria bacterium]|nr:hypothetical protein [Candidatus Saccharibacteria bacterium]
MQKEAKYWQKNGENTKKVKDLVWNLPEQKNGEIAIIGGNASSFSTEIKTAEYINRNLPFVKSVKLFFPDALKTKLPPLENFQFFESTESGSFKRSPELKESLKAYNYSIFLGDLSKNSETALAIAEMVENSKNTPLLFTRDAVDLLLESINDISKQNNMTFVLTLSQLQKLFRAVYYPKALFLSQPLFPIIEAIHKFTLSYPFSILTFHEGEIICASSGDVITIPIDKTSYSPLNMWSGELAAKIAIFKLFNSNEQLFSLASAVLY